MPTSSSIRASLSVAVLLIAAGSSAASTTTLTLVPGPSYTNTIGNASSSAPGFGSGSFQANAGPGQKSEIYIPATSLFATAPRLSEIASISYWTNKAGDATTPDWTFIMYTAPLGAGNGDSASWYHTRLNSEPYFSGASVPSNTWHEWSTTGPNPMRFYDQPRGGNFGTYTDPTLATLQAGPVTWDNSATYDYGTAADVVSLFSFQTGSAWANGFTGLLDGLTVTLTNGDVGIVNFENELSVVPLPTAAWAGISTLACAAGLGFVRRRRQLA